MRAWSVADKQALIGDAAIGSERSRMGGRSVAAAQADRAFGAADRLQTAWTLRRITWRRGVALIWGMVQEECETWRNPPAVNGWNELRRRIMGQEQQP